MEDGVGILTKKVTEEPYKIFKTLKPFTLKVWGAIGVVIMVVGILLFVINCLSPYTVDGQDVQVDTASEQKKLKANLWVIYGSFLEQGLYFSPIKMIFILQYSLKYLTFFTLLHFILSSKFRQSIC